MTKNTKKPFESTSGAGVADVRTFLAKEKWTIERDNTYKCRRWIMSGADREPRYIRYNPTMGEMLAELTKLGVKKFVDLYETPTDGKNHKIRKERKEIKKVAASKKGVKRVNAPKVAELKEKHVELVLKRMRLDITPKEKEKVRAELAEIRAKITELGGDTCIGSANPERGASGEYMKEAHRRGEEKKREKKRLKEDKKYVTNSAGKVSTKGKKKVNAPLDDEDDAETYEDLMEG